MAWWKRRKELTPGHPNPTASPTWWIHSAGFLDTRSVGDGGGNSIVVACLQVIASGLAEAPLETWFRDPRSQVFNPNPMHPATELWNNPNPHMTPDNLLWYITWSTHIDGNAYLYKTRNEFGEVIELWPLLPNQVEPVAPTDGSRFISAWRYTANGKENLLPVEDVIHITLGLDPNNHRRGFAPLKAVLREILGDEEASRFTVALLKNMGVPGVIISPNAPGDPGPSQDEADAIKSEYQQKFGGGKRGEPLVLTGPMKVDVVSWSPQALNLMAMHRLPEERVCAVLGVPPIMAQLGAGLERSTFANMDEAGEHFAERKLIPTWRSIEKQLSHGMRNDFEFDQNQFMRFDTRPVRALQEEMSNLWLRVDRSIRSGWITVADGRRIVGLETRPEDDIYLRPITTAAVPVGLNFPTVTVMTSPAALDAPTDDT